MNKFHEKIHEPNWRRITSLVTSNQCRSLARCSPLRKNEPGSSRNKLRARGRRRKRKRNFAIIEGDRGRTGKRLRLRSYFMMKRNGHNREKAENAVKIGEKRERGGPEEPERRRAKRGCNYTGAMIVPRRRSARKAKVIARIDKQTWKLFFSASGAIASLSIFFPLYPLCGSLFFLLLSPLSRTVRCCILNSIRCTDPENSGHIRSKRLHFIFRSVCACVCCRVTS